jgi:hypothetical protein
MKTTTVLPAFATKPVAKLKLLKGKRLVIDKRSAIFISPYSVVAESGVEPYPSSRPKPFSL